MRPFKLGLSRPKSKKNVISVSNKQSESKYDGSDVDEIDVSRETIDSISNVYLQSAVKKEPQSDFGSSNDTTVADSQTNDVEMKDVNITDLVNKISNKHVIKENINIGVAERYDIKQQYEPVAGTSTVAKSLYTSQHNDDSFSSSPDDNECGIQSFYNKSRFFDISIPLEDNKNDTSYIEDTETANEDKKSQVTRYQVKDMNLSLNASKSSSDFSSTGTIVTPKIRPPTKNYVIASLEHYKIPKVRNQEPFYSDHKDSGDKIEIGQMLLKLQSKSAKDQKPFEKVLDVTSIDEWRQLLFLQTNENNDDTTKPEALKTILAGNKQYVLEPLCKPPTTSEVIQFIQDKQNEKIDDTIDVKEITKNLDELETSQAIGLNEDEVNSSLSLETNDKVSFR